MINYKKRESLSGRDEFLLGEGISDISKIKAYQPGKPLEEVKRELGLKNVIKLASNENPLGPSPKAAEAIRGYASKINFYPDGGSYYLKKALGEKLGVKEENIILGNGSDEIVSLVTRIFLQKGDEAIMGDPSFLMYKIDAQLSRAKVASIPLKNFRLDLSEMSKAIGPKTKLIFISNPNNPTGTIITEDEAEHFLRDVPPRILTVFDEAYYEYVEDTNYPQSIDLLDKNSNIIILRTFSKIYGLAGLRVGYGVGSPEIIGLLNKARPPFNVNSLAQVAALASLEDEDQVNRSKSLVREGKEFLYSNLRKLKVFFIPTEANFILIKIGKKAKDVEAQLLKKGIIVRGMRAYNLPHYIRVTIGTKPQNEEFIKNLQTILCSL
ncbi:MAG: histidinol-phosphate transaminase [bacterium]